MEEKNHLFAITGWLMQKTALFRRDRKLFGIVTDDQFQCFQDEQMTIHYMTVPLNDLKSVCAVARSARPCFVITKKDGEEITFYCDSRHQTKKWICALQLTPFTEKHDLSHYELIKIIGAGSYGTVYLAKSKFTGEFYALKVIDKSHMLTCKKREYVQSERNTLMRAKHPFIIHLFNAFQTPSHLFFVLEFAQGGDLKFHITREYFSEEQIKMYLAEIALALQNLHDLGIIYRDLKPENILLDLNGHIKLADFGTSRNLGTENEATSFCGTVEYIAPEVITKKPQTFAVDWWSYGVIAFELLCHRLPFTSASRNTLFNKIQNEPVRWREAIEPITKDFVEQLLEKNPAKRLGSAGNSIFDHQFFDDIDWKKVSNKEYEPEFVPQNDPNDITCNFNQLYTDRAVIPDQLIGDDEGRIEGFSYQDNITEF